MSNELISFWLLCFTSFFTLLNPLGTMPIFLTMTMDIDKNARKKVALKASFISFITIVFFAVSGHLIFKFFGISINSLRVVGGIIFLFIGMDMLQARLVRSKVNESEVKSYVNDISVTPLAIPMICGPGAITNAIILWDQADNAMQMGAMVSAVLLVTTLVYLILRSSSTILKYMGETGNNVLMRLMGLIIMVIGVEFFISGLKPMLL